MRTPFIFSVSAHAVVIAATLLTWPSHKDVASPVVITVDTYTIDEMTNMPPVPEATPAEEALEDVMEPVPDPETAKAEAVPEEEPAPEPEKTAVKLPKPKVAPPKPEAQEFNLARLENMLLKDKSKTPENRLRHKI